MKNLKIHCSQPIYILAITVRGYKVNPLAINSTTAVAGKAGFTLASAATAVVEFMAKWLTLYPRTVSIGGTNFLDKSELHNRLFL